MEMTATKVTKTGTRQGDSRVRKNTVHTPEGVRAWGTIKARANLLFSWAVPRRPMSVLSSKVPLDGLRPHANVETLVP